MVAPAVTIGSVVAGRYEVEDSLGEGGMGAVWAVTDLETKASLALKVVLEATPEHVARFAREAKATMRIQSDHVVRVVDVGAIDDKRPFMVMERLEGETLKTLVAGGPLDERQVADLFLQACEGLAHAHALGIVHRDVKPSNLFVIAGREQALKIVDFGIARMTSYEAYENREKTATVTDSAALLGSPQFVSPEQLSAPSGVDERADIWSLGISMYFALTGRLPFNGASLAEILVAVMSYPMPALGGNVSAPMAAVVQRCLARSLDERFRRVGDLARALAPLASPARAALLPRIEAVLRASDPIVAAAPKHPRPSDRTHTVDAAGEPLDNKATIEDLSAFRPPTDTQETQVITRVLPRFARPEPQTASSVGVTAPPMPVSKGARSMRGLAIGAALVVAISGGALVTSRLRQPRVEAVASVPAAEPAEEPATQLSDPAPEPSADRTATEALPLELIAEGPIAKVVRPTRQRVEILETGKALLRVGALKADLPIEVELANGARAKGIARPGGPTTIALTTVRTRPGPAARPPKPATSASELHKNPYD